RLLRARSRGRRAGAPRGGARDACDRGRHDHARAGRESGARPHRAGRAGDGRLSMTLWAVVPAKALATAKSRLAPLPSPDQRQGVAAALLRDVLAALRSTTDVARVMVISADPAALDLADSLGAAVLAEPSPARALPGTEDAATPGEDGEVALNAALDHAGAVA